MKRSTIKRSRVLRFSAFALALVAFALVVWMPVSNAGKSSPAYAIGSLQDDSQLIIVPPSGIVYGTALTRTGSYEYEYSSVALPTLRPNIMIMSDGTIVLRFNSDYNCLYDSSEITNYNLVISATMQFDELPERPDEEREYDSYGPLGPAALYANWSDFWIGEGGQEELNHLVDDYVSLNHPDAWELSMNPFVVDAGANIPLYSSLPAFELATSSSTFERSDPICYLDENFSSRVLQLNSTDNNYFDVDTSGINLFFRCSKQGNPVLNDLNAYSVAIKTSASVLGWESLVNYNPWLGHYSDDNHTGLEFDTESAMYVHLPTFCQLRIFNGSAQDDYIEFLLPMYSTPALYGGEEIHYFVPQVVDEEGIYNAGYLDGVAKGKEDGYKQGYEEGESAGFIDGETQGRLDGYNDGYEAGNSAGYDSGYTAGNNDGHSAGYTEGWNVGNKHGYGEGYSRGTEEASSYTFSSLMYSIVDAPVKVFSSLFNIEILGVNLSGFALSLLSICLVIAVARFIMG